MRRVLRNLDLDCWDGCRGIVEFENHGIYYSEACWYKFIMQNAAEEGSICGPAKEAINELHPGILGA